MENTKRSYVPSRDGMSGMRRRSLRAAICASLACSLVFALLLGASGPTSRAWAAEDIYITDTNGNRLENGATIDADLIASGFIIYARIPSADDGHGGSFRNIGWEVKIGGSAYNMTTDKYTESSDGYYTVIRVHSMPLPNIGDTVSIKWNCDVHQSYPVMEGGEYVWRDPNTGTTYLQSQTKVDPTLGQTYVEVNAEGGGEGQRIYLKPVTTTEYVGHVGTDLSLIVGGQAKEEEEGDSIGEELDSEAGGNQQNNGGGGNDGGGKLEQPGGSNGGVKVEQPAVSDEPTFTLNGEEFAEMPDEPEAPEVADEAVSSLNTPASAEVETEPELEQQGLAFTGIPGAISANELVGLGRVCGLEGISGASASAGDPADVQAEEAFFLLRVLTSFAFAIVLALALVVGLIYQIARYRRGLAKPSRFVLSPATSTQA